MTAISKKTLRDFYMGIQRNWRSQPGSDAELQQEKGRKRLKTGGKSTDLSLAKVARIAAGRESMKTTLLTSKVVTTTC